MTPDRVCVCVCVALWATFLGERLELRREMVAPVDNEMK